LVAETKVSAAPLKTIAKHKPLNLCLFVLVQFGPSKTEWMKNYPFICFYRISSDRKIDILNFYFLELSWLSLFLIYRIRYELFISIVSRHKCNFFLLLFWCNTNRYVWLMRSLKQGCSFWEKRSRSPFIFRFH